MYRRADTSLLVAAVVLLPLLLASSSCAAGSTHRIRMPRPLPPVLLRGGDAGVWGSFGRSRARLGRLPEGRGELAATARRLGQRESLDKPPSPKPRGTPNTEMPAPPPSVNK